MGDNNSYSTISHTVNSNIFPLVVTTKERPFLNLYILHATVTAKNVIPPTLSTTGIK